MEKDSQVEILQKTTNILIKHVRSQKEQHDLVQDQKRDWICEYERLASEVSDCKSEVDVKAKKFNQKEPITKAKSLVADLGDLEQQYEKQVSIKRMIRRKGFQNEDLGKKLGTVIDETQNRQTVLCKLQSSCEEFDEKLMNMTESMIKGISNYNDTMGDASLMREFKINDNSNNVSNLTKNDNVLTYTPDRTLKFKDKAEDSQLKISDFPTPKKISDENLAAQLNMNTTKDHCITPIHPTDDFKVAPYLATNDIIQVNNKFQTEVSIFKKFIEESNKVISQDYNDFVVLRDETFENQEDMLQSPNQADRIKNKILEALKYTPRKDNYMSERNEFYADKDSHAISMNNLYADYNSYNQQPAFTTPNKGDLSPSQLDRSKFEDTEQGTAKKNIDQRHLNSEFFQQTALTAKKKFKEKINEIIKNYEEPLENTNDKAPNDFLQTIKSLKNDLIKITETCDPMIFENSMYKDSNFNSNNKAELSLNNPELFKQTMASTKAFSDLSLGINVEKKYQMFLGEKETLVFQIEDLKQQLNKTSLQKEDQLAQILKMTEINRSSQNETRKNELTNNKLLDDLNLTNSQKEILQFKLVEVTDDLDDVNMMNDKLSMRAAYLEGELNQKGSEVQKFQDLYNNLQENSTYIIREANFAKEDYENLKVEKNYLLEKADKELQMQKQHSQLEILNLESHLTDVKLELQIAKGDDQDTVEQLANQKEEMDKKSYALTEELERFESEFSKYNLDFKSNYQSEMTQNKNKEYFTQENLYKNMPYNNENLYEIKERFSSQQELTDRNMMDSDKHISGKKSIFGSEKQISIKMNTDNSKSGSLRENYISMTDFKNNQQIELELNKTSEQVSDNFEFQPKKFTKPPEYSRQFVRTSTDEEQFMSPVRESREKPSSKNLSKKSVHKNDSLRHLESNADEEDFYTARGTDNCSPSRSQLNNKSQADHTILEYQKMIGELTTKLHMLSQSYKEKLSELDTCKKELEDTKKTNVEKATIDYDSFKQKSGRQTFQSLNNTEQNEKGIDNNIVFQIPTEEQEELYQYTPDKVGVSSKMRSTINEKDETLGFYNSVQTPGDINDAENQRLKTISAIGFNNTAGNSFNFNVDTELTNNLTTMKQSLPTTEDKIVIHSNKTANQSFNKSSLVSLKQKYKEKKKENNSLKETILKMEAKICELLNEETLPRDLQDNQHDQMSNNDTLEQNQVLDLDKEMNTENTMLKSKIIELEEKLDDFYNKDQNAINNQIAIKNLERENNKLQEEVDDMNKKNETMYQTERTHRDKMGDLYLKVLSTGHKTQRKKDDDLSSIFKDCDRIEQQLKKQQKKLRKATTFSEALLSNRR